MWPKFNNLIQDYLFNLYRITKIADFIKNRDKNYEFKKIWKLNISNFKKKPRLHIFKNKKNQNYIQIKI